MAENVRKILKYEAGWHPRENVGIISALLEDGEQPVTIWKGNDKVEFNSLMLILGTSESPYLTGSGWVVTGADVPGIE